MDVIFAAKHIRVIIPAQGLVQCFSINVKVLSEHVGLITLSSSSMLPSML